MIRRSVYIAAPYARRIDALWFSERVKAQGWRVTSTWLTEDTDNNLTPERAARDLRQVKQSEVLVKLPNTFWRKSTGGKFVELGYALAKRLTVAVIGPVESIFDLHPGVERFEDEDEFLDFLRILQ